VEGVGQFGERVVDVRQGQAGRHRIPVICQIRTARDGIDRQPRGKSTDHSPAESLNPAHHNAIVICAPQMAIAQSLFVSTAGRE
jgi:hypothetical protein